MSKTISFLVFLFCCDLIACDGYFSVVGSKLLRHKANYRVSVTSQGYDSPQTLEVAIRTSESAYGDNDDYVSEEQTETTKPTKTTKKKKNIYENVQNVTLQNGKSQLIEFDLKDQPEGNYNLEVKSLTGDFEKIQKLNMNMKKQTVLVQTDKAMYKPADKVQFRVIILNAAMMPSKGAKVQIFVSDGAQNRVMQFDDVKLTKGVFQGELQLSDLPVLGNWEIKVKFGSGKETTKQFEVAEYTLPKFEVKIDANPDANFKDGKIRATVRAKYTFGKIAKGNATVTAEVENSYHPWRHWGSRSEPSIKVIKTIEVDGKKPVEFDMDKELEIKDKNRECSVKLTATFTEELTGREQNATAKVQIHVTPHKIELKKSSDRIKPGLPYSVTAIVQHHDKNAPVTDKSNPVKFTVKYYYDKMKNCTRRRFLPWQQFAAETTTILSDTTSDDLETTETPIETTTEPIETYECREEHSYDELKEQKLEGGMAKLDINLPLNTTRIDVEAKYLETTASSAWIQRAESENDQFIQIKSLTDNPKLSENVKIEVLATENLKELTYQVVGKGEVIVSVQIQVPDKKSFQFEIKPTLEMLPKASLIVHYITPNGEIISDSLKLEFGNELRSQIDISLSKEQVKPGQNVDITISTKPNSFVGLLGVDQSVLVLKSGNDIDQATVSEELEKYNHVDKYNYEYIRHYDYTSYRDFGEDAIIITNAKKEFEKKYIPIYHDYEHDRVYYNQPVYAMSSMGSAGGLSLQDRVDDRVIVSTPAQRRPESGKEAPQPVVIRTEFPETWLFESFDLDSSTSNVTLSRKAPDTITSWIITGFSVDPMYGLGLTRQPTKLSVFQSFFVTTNLPYSIKRGEVVSIPVLVFNYMDSDHEAEVTLFNSDAEFEFTEVNEDENQVNRPKRSIELQRKKRVMVKSQSGVTVSFMIRPLKVGHIKIKVTGTTDVAGDGLERQLIVEPEGVTQFKNKAVLVDLRSGVDFSTELSIEVPNNAVPDSTRVEVSAVGDILGPTLENLDKLIQLPYGCGEQNMLNFVPNIVVLDYLTILNKLTPEIASKAKTFMESGYQRELSYKHDDGSYSAFGKSDQYGSTWLTAFVAKSFHQASRHIMVDPEIVKQALNFLANVQAKNGSFPELGHVSHKDMQGGAANGIALTAYTLITFLENKDSASNHKATIDKALAYIHNNIDSIDDIYALAITAYALNLANESQLKTSTMSKLMQRANDTDNMKFWEKPVPTEDANQRWYYKPTTVNVEMSAYGLQALLEAGMDSDAISVMRWLVTQRNENGGFHGTQDTVVGLQALSKLAAKIYSPNSKIAINVKPNVGSTANIEINEQNSLILQKFELPPAARSFEVSAAGRGMTILQVAYRYNLNNDGEGPRFTLEPEVDSNSNKDFLHLRVCTSFVADSTTTTSNMAVMEVSFPSGFTFDSDSLEELKATENVKKIETKDGDTVVVVYFDNIGAKKICPELKAYRTHSVALQKPAPVVIYDYYDNSRIARSFYNPPEVSLCDICNGAEECKDDCEVPEINIV